MTMPDFKPPARSITDSLAHVRGDLPERATLQVDDEVIDTIAGLVQDLMAMTPVVVDERTGPDGRPL